MRIAVGVGASAVVKFVMGNDPRYFFVCVRLARWRRTLLSDPALHMHSSTSTTLSLVRNRAAALGFAHGATLCLRLSLLLTGVRHSNYVVYK